MTTVLFDNSHIKTILFKVMFTSKIEYKSIVIDCLNLEEICFISFCKKYFFAFMVQQTVILVHIPYLQRFSSLYEPFEHNYETK